MIFGGKDDSLVSGPWVYHPVRSSKHWLIEATKLSVGHVDSQICSREKPCKLIIDTGTTIITGPS